MTISNSIDFTVTRDDIITEALEQLGVLGEGEIPTAAQITSANRTLNMIIKAWQADGLNLFAVDTLFLFPQKGQSQYVLTNTSGTHFTRNFVSSTVSLAVADGTSASQIRVESLEGMSEGDYVGVYSEDGTMQWRRIVFFNESFNGINVNQEFVGPIAEGAHVVAYTTPAQRPMKLVEAYFRNLSSGMNIPVMVTPRRTYDILSPVAQSGVINQVYYDPQVVYPALHVWPIPTSTPSYLRLVVQRTLSDVDDATNNFDLPQEWYMPLAYALALAMSTKHGVPPSTYQMIEREAMRYYEMARGFDSELYTSIQFQPDNLRRG